MLGETRTAPGPDDALAAGGRAALARLRRFGGDALVRDMAVLFTGMAAERLAVARRAAASGDREALRDAAHGLRSSYAQFGASEAARRSLDVETAVERGEPVPALVHATARLQEACAVFDAWLAAELRGASPDAG